MNKDDIDGITSFISKHFNLDLPHDINCERDLKLKDQYHQYFITQTFDCCTCGECVYVGQYKELIWCKSCGKERYYSSCRYSSCAFKSYEYRCLAHLHLRKSQHQIKYRSIKLLLNELVKLESFREIINYDDITDESTFSEKKSKDTFNKNMKEMKANFQKYLQNLDPVKRQKFKEIIEINLAISWFYDSFMIHHRKASTFSPLIITIRNLPPNIKNSLGFGTFLLAFWEI